MLEIVPFHESSKMKDRRAIIELRRSEIQVLAYFNQGQSCDSPTSSCLSIAGEPMTLTRRQFSRFLSASVAAPAVARIARAQSYPTRPVRVVVPYAAAGAADIVARLLGQWLSERFGQQFVIENRPGAASNIGTESVVRAPPDGYTLLLASSSNAINATLYRKLNYDFTRDIVPVAGIMRLPNVMAVPLSVPAATVPEFIAYAKDNPNKINYASGGIGTVLHVAGELFNMMAGLTMVHVPYRGGEGPALTDLIGGQVQVMFGGATSSIEHIKAGRLRGLAVTTAARSPALPDLPTVGDFLPGFEASTWLGVGAPRNTSTEIINELNKETNAALADTEMRSRFGDLGGTVLSGSPSDFRTLVASETNKWAGVVKFAGLKAD
jgi:tripartite-type tricarboxylate transporter receptor subunit TctC